jgi:pimeloyl-ACP methyl ester carboxylesterase
MMRRGESSGWGWLVAGAVGAAGAAAQEAAARTYYARTPGPSDFVADDERSAWTPAWHELLAPAEWLQLRLSPTYRGEGIPRGDGAPVVLVHGFLTNGFYLAPLRAWLRRMAYGAETAAIGWNTDCLDVLAGRLARQVIATLDATGRAVHLVGHSLGGILARAVAGRLEHAIASVTTLASPFRGLRVHPGLRLAAGAVRAGVHGKRPGVDPACLTLGCGCDTVATVRARLPAELPQLAVFSRHDGLVDWRYCFDPETTEAIAVAASHMGVALHPQTFRALAVHLASPVATARARSA